MRGSEAQCTVPSGSAVPGMVVQVVACEGEEYHAGAIEGAVTTVVAHLTCWMAVYPESGQGQNVCFDPMLLLPRRYRN